MLKIIGLPNESAFSKNNNNRLASKSNDSDNKIDGYGINRNDIEHAKKSEKSSKSRKLSKLKKSSKSRKLFKSRKSKSKKTSKS